MWSLENFLSVSIIFLLSWNFFKRRICFILFLSSVFRHVFPNNPDIFQVFFVGKLRNFSISSPYLYASPEFFQKKNPLFSLSITQFQTFFPCHRDNFHVFSRAGKEIFLPVFIIFVLFPGLFKGKIHIFRNEFSVRTYIFNRCFSLLKSKHLLTKRHVLG